VGDVLKAVGQEGYRFSVLTVNTEGYRENYGGTVVPRQVRYGRIPQWMKDTGTIPDIIAFQEVVLAKKFYLAPAILEDWQMPWEIISGISAQTGVTYRIAYFVVGPSNQGLNPVMWSGSMLLYNPARVVHVPYPSGSVPQPALWDDTQQTTSYLRSSPPLGSGLDQATREKLSSLIDGPAWMGSGTAYARFSLVGARDARFSTYQLHFVPDPTAFDSLRDFVTQTEQRFAGNDTYPPVMLGDFNIGMGDMSSETTANPGGAFDGFQMAGYFSDDVMGVLAGRQAASQTPSATRREFKSRFPLVVKQVQILPNESKTDAWGDHGGGPTTTWGDHVGIFVEFQPY